MNTLKLTALVLGWPCCLVSSSSAQEQAAPFSSLLTPRQKACYSTETEAFKPLTKKIFKNILLDQRGIWTSPFHMKRSEAKWWVLVGAATGVLIATDHWTSHQLPNTKDPVGFSRNVSNAGI